MRLAEGIIRRIYAIFKISGADDYDSNSPVEDGPRSLGIDAGTGNVIRFQDVNWVL